MSEWERPHLLEYWIAMKHVVQAKEYLDAAAQQCRRVADDELVEGLVRVAATLEPGIQMLEAKLPEHLRRRK